MIQRPKPLKSRKKDEPHSLYRVRGPNFTCGFEVNQFGKVTKSAPLIRKWVFGKSLDAALKALKRSNFTVEQVELDRSCGECNECCTSSGVTEIKKHAGVRCQFLDPTSPLKSCSIYKDRPNACRTFKCGWLQGIMSLDQRPDKIGLVITPFPAQFAIDQVTFVIIITDEEKAGDLKTGNLRKALDEIIALSGGEDVRIVNQKTKSIIHLYHGEIRKGRLHDQDDDDYERLSFEVYNPPIGKYLVEDQKGE